MKIHFTESGIKYEADLAKPLDISIPIVAGEGRVNCFYAPYVEFSPVVAGDFIGSTREGGPVNFFNVRINPHGNGTHTECVGHIAREKFTINQCLTPFHFLAKLVSVFPEKTEDGDRIIRKQHLEEMVKQGEATGLIIRTLPNDDLKMQTNYSGSNPPYILEDAMHFLVNCGVQHLLIDLPSVDREEDDGKLLAHKAFWQYPGQIREKCTITELVYATNSIKDGLYLVNLQIASFELDVSPSKPVLYQLSQVH